MKVTEHFKVCNAFHKAMADYHDGCEKDHRAIAEECDGEMAKRHESLANRHAAMKAAETEHAKHHAAMFSAAADKAALDELEKSRRELEPTQVRRVVPSNPTAVIRTGSAPLQKADLDPEFAAIVSAGDDRSEE